MIILIWILKNQNEDQEFQNDENKKAHNLFIQSELNDLARDITK